MIRDPDGEEPVASRSSQVPWASKFLTNLKIWPLFENVLKWNFFLNLAWTILKYLVSSYVFTQDFLLYHRGIVLQYLFKYVNMLTISRQ